MYLLSSPKNHRLKKVPKPILVGIAKDNYLSQNGTHMTLQDSPHLGDGVNLKFGQDITHGNRVIPKDYDMDSNVNELKASFFKLKGIFGSGDKSGVVDKIFSKFISPTRTSIVMVQLYWRLFKPLFQILNTSHAELNNPTHYGYVCNCKR